MNLVDRCRGKNILIVDDDSTFRSILEKSLARNHMIPTLAENGKTAQQILGLGECDLVISDIRMPGMNGVQLLHWIKANRPIPVILMTGFSEIAETHEAAQIGAAGFLAKPFTTNDLLQSIADCFPEDTSQRTENENLDDQYCKISIDDFISGKEMQFDIFIRIKESKYIKIAYGGENLPLERIKSYKSKDIQFLYMRKEDLKRYLGFNLNLMNAVAQSKDINSKKKVGFIRHATEVLLQSFFVSDISQDDFQHATALVENAVSILSDNSDATNLLYSLSQHTDHLYAHCVGVSLYSSLIGKALGWASPTTVFRLSVGGLMHDIGLKEIRKEVLDTPRASMTAEQIQLIESHPDRGAEILSRLSQIPADIVQIAHQHQENCIGTGYPNRLRKSKIHPFARVIAVADKFCELVMAGPDSLGLSPAQALHRMVTFTPNHYDDAALKALAQVFKMPETIFQEIDHVRRARSI